MTREPVSALIALGGNVGEVGATMQGALDRLHAEPGLCVVAVSPVYRTPPWGITDQPRFLNACAELRTDLAPEALLLRVREAERLAGRARARRWGPRTLDIDILAHGEVAMRTPELTLPHPRLFERAFVLVPLADIAPFGAIGGRSVRKAAQKADRTGIEMAETRLCVPK